MMIKFRTKRKDKSPHWLVVSDVKEISYEIHKYADAEARLEEFSKGTKTRLLRAFTELKGNLLEIWVVYSDDSREVIYTDDSVFLMNNDGKTTELIYP